MNKKKINEPHIELQIATHEPSIPTLEQLQRWIFTTLEEIPHTNDTQSELTIRFIGKGESRELNQHYRGKIKPTNVLSFPDEAIPGFPSTSFGDLAICAPVVIEEAHKQDKTIEAHFAHLVIHGFLHLLGYDHLQEKEAEEMEALEIQLLSKLGYENPYEDKLTL